MRTETYTVTRNIYHFNELSDESKGAFIENQYSQLAFNDSRNEMEKTLEAFSKAFNVCVYDWDSDGYQHWFQFYMDEENHDEVSGMRLTKYVINHFQDNVETGKYYSINHGTFKCRHSNIIREIGCPFTGCFFDCCVLSPIIECVNYKKVYKSLRDLIDDCLESLFNAFEDDYQNKISYDNVNETSEINDWEFNEKGEII